MQFAARKRHLIEALETLSSIVSPIRHLLVNSNHLYIVAPKSNNVYCVASNGSSSVCVSLPADVQKKGHTLLPLEHTRDIFQQVPDDRIIAIDCPPKDFCRYEIMLPSSPPDIAGKIINSNKYPDFIPNPKGMVPLFQVQERELKRGLEDVVPFVAKESGLKLWAQCVLIQHTQNDDLEFIAAANRMAAHTVLPIINSLSGSILVYGPTLFALMNLLKDTQDLVDCYYHENQILFSVPRLNLFLSCYSQHDKFPDLGNLYPNEYEVDIVVETDKLLSAVSMTIPYCPDEHDVIHLFLKDALFQIKVDKRQIGEASIEIPCSIVRSLPEFQVKINAHRLLNVLNCVNSERFRLKIRIRNNPLVVVTPQDRSTRYALFPE